MLAVSNFGYVLAHVFAISGFLLLRKDRPSWPRPIRVGPGWVAVAWFCLVYDVILLVVGAISFKLTGYGSSWSILALVARRPGRRAARVHLARRRRGQEAAPVEAPRADDAGGGGGAARRGPGGDHGLAHARAFLRPLSEAGGGTGRASRSSAGSSTGARRAGRSSSRAASSWCRRARSVPAASRACDAQQRRDRRVRVARGGLAQRQRAADRDVRDAVRGRHAQRLAGARTQHLRRRVAAGDRDPALRLPSQTSGIELVTTRTRVPPCALRNARTAAGDGAGTCRPPSTFCSRRPSASAARPMSGVAPRLASAAT